MSDENAKAAKVAKVHGLSGLGDLCVQDVRFALRLLRKTPVLSGAIVLTIARSTGATL
jgi:hypothetical protein